MIMGIGRSGKTTLSNMLKNKFVNYNLIHSDSLKWAMIRAQDKEKYYRTNIDKQKEFEQSEYFQKTLLEFFNSSTSTDENHYGYILESGQLHPKIVKEIIDLCVKYDTEKDWTFELPKEYLKKHAKDWFLTNEMLKRECPKYEIKYYDTSKNRTEILKEIMEEIVTNI